MNYTREPIIETIITPKDGCKLIIRNSKGGSQEEYAVDAVEVVSFGQSMFFRSLEKPKSFLLPVGDYEIVETKETRVVLKNAPLEHPIKIGGGKTQKTGKEKDIEDEKSRRRKTSRRRKPSESGHGSEEESKRLEQVSAPKEHIKENRPQAEGPGRKEESKVSSSMFRNLFPPPTKLISDSINREDFGKKVEGNLFSDDVMPKPEESKEQESIESEKDVDHETEDRAELTSDADEPVKEEPKKSEESDKYRNSPRYHEAPKQLPKESFEEDDSMQKVGEEVFVPSFNPEANLI